MNHIYKLKFDKNTQELKVVSELTNNASIQTSNLDLSLETNNININSVQTHSSLFTVSVLATALFGAITTNALANTDISGTHNQLGTVVAGTASSVTDGLVTTIKNSPNAIINWQSFNINQNEILKFVQNTADSTVLNRVVGKDVSKILGSLQSNGQVFVVNPNGIIFGKNSQVNVGSLVASTLDINNKDFLNGRYVFNKDKDYEIAQVLNSGVIKVNTDGSLALIGGQVLNNGVLEARNGTVFLLAGNSIEIADLTNPQVSYKVTAKNKAVNLGRVFGKNAVLLGNKVLNGNPSAYAGNTFADVIGSSDTNANQASINADGSVTLFGGSEADTFQSTDQTNAQVVGTRNGGVINNGVINVSNIDGKAGIVKVLGDIVIADAHSQILATGNQGGKVVIGGDATGKGKVKLAQQAYFDKEQLVNISAEQEAGNAVVWSDSTKVDGNFEATSVNSHGGFIETSGHSIGFGDNLSINTASVNGDSGSWLIDPDYFAVVGSADDLAKIKGKKLGDDLTFPTDNINEWENPSLDNTKKDNSKATGNSYITQDKLNTVIASESTVVLYAEKGLVLYNATFTDTSTPNLKTLYLYTVPDKHQRYYTIDKSVLLIQNSTIKNSKLDLKLNQFSGDDSSKNVNDYDHYRDSLGGHTIIENSTIQVNSITHIIKDYYKHSINVTNTTINTNDLCLSANYTNFEKVNINYHNATNFLSLTNVSNSTINSDGSISVRHTNNVTVTAVKDIKANSYYYHDHENFIKNSTLTSTGKGNITILTLVDDSQIRTEGNVTIKDNISNAIIDAQNITAIYGGRLNNSTFNAKDKLEFRVNSSLEATDLIINAKDVDINGGENDTGIINITNSKIQATNYTSFSDSNFINITNTQVISPKGISVKNQQSWWADGVISLNNNTFEATDNKFELIGDHVNLNNNTITANSASLSNSNRTIEQESNNRYIKKQNLDLVNTTINTVGDTVIHANHNVNLSESVIAASDSTSEINVTANNKVNLEKATQLTAGHNVSITAINNIYVTGSKKTPIIINAKSGNISIKARKDINEASDITLSNVQATAKDNTEIHATNNLNINDSTLTGKVFKSNAIASNVENAKLTFKDHTTINAGTSNKVINSNVTSDHITANSSLSSADFKDSNLLSGCNMDVNVMNNIDINNSNLTSSCGQILHSFNGNINADKSKFNSNNGHLDLYSKNDINLQDSELLSKDRLVVNSLDGHYNIVNSDLRSTEKYIDLTSNNGNNVVTDSNLITNAGCLVRFPLDMDGTELTDNNLNKCPVNSYNPNNLRTEIFKSIIPKEPIEITPEIQYQNNNNVFQNQEISYYSNKERQAVRDPSRSIVPSNFFSTGYTYRDTEYQGEACSIDVPKIIYQYKINVNDLYLPNLQVKYKISAHDLNILRECYTYRPDYNNDQPLKYHDNIFISYAKKFKVLNSYSYQNRALNNH